MDKKVESLKFHWSGEELYSFTCTRWGYSCWPWRKTRKDCKHIPVIKNNPTAPDEVVTYNLVTVIPDKYVNKPKYDEKEKLFYVPLIPLNPYDLTYFW